MLNIRPIKKDTEINDSKTHGVPREQRMTKCGVLLYEGATSSSLARCRWSCRGGWRAALGPPLCGSFRSPPPRVGAFPNTDSLRTEPYDQASLNPPRTTRTQLSCWNTAAFLEREIKLVFEEITITVSVAPRSHSCMGENHVVVFTEWLNNHWWGVLQLKIQHLFDPSPQLMGANGCWGGGGGSFWTWGPKPTVRW